MIEAIGFSTKNPLGFFTSFTPKNFGFECFIIQKILDTNIYFFINKFTLDFYLTKIMQ